MKSCISILYFLFICLPFVASAQNLLLKNNSSIFKHEVSGIILDSLNTPLASVTVVLVSDKDSIQCASNNEGIFIFKRIASSVFKLTITHVGFTSLVSQYYFNPKTLQIVIDPIILRSGAIKLKEVLVNGAPSIVYKTDTVEYKAADYKITKNSRLDDLLKQVQGVDVGSDGSLSYLGQQITKARLNGKNFAGGDVAQTIQNLPAEVADRIQFVDDYGVLANRTGIKSNDPIKILNITTKNEKSVGNFGQFSAGVGTDKRYNERIFAQHLNGNQEIGLIANTTNTINNVSGYGDNNTSQQRSSSSGSLRASDGSGGETTLSNFSLNYRSQLTNDLQVNASYFFTKNNNYIIQQSNTNQINPLSPLNINTLSDKTTTSNNHNVSLELEYSSNSRNFLTISPTFNFRDTYDHSDELVGQHGLINQSVESHPQNRISSPLAGAAVYYQHIFNKPGRNVSLQLTYFKSNVRSEDFQNDRINYLTSLSQFIRDSVVSRSNFKRNLNNNVNANLSYLEPFGRTSSIQFMLQSSYNHSNNIFDVFNTRNDTQIELDSLSYQFKSDFFQNQISSTYQFKSSKTTIGIGADLRFTDLKVSETATGRSYNNYRLFILPILKFQYIWTPQQNLSLYYTPTLKEPTYFQLQPKADYSNPISTVFGNPELKPSITNNITFNYYNYLINERLNIAAKTTFSFLKNQVTSNSLQIFDNNLGTYVNQVFFKNLNGTYNLNSNVSIAKQLNNRAYNIEYNIAYNYSHLVALNNNILTAINSWHVVQRIGPKIMPGERLQVYPFFAYDITSIQNGGQLNNIDVLRTASFNVNGKINFEEKYFGSLDIYKNYTSGLNATQNNPFIINFSIERAFSHTTNGRIKFQVFDLLNQNTFVNRIITANNITDLSASSLRRYFMLSAIINLQKWGGFATKNGKQLKRRGDGSFIYP